MESLLFEGIPVAKTPLPQVVKSHVPVRPLVDEELTSRIWNEETITPAVHLQGNGHYSLMISNSGAGYSRFHDFDITRWRADTTMDAWGTFLYLRDLRSGSAWSATLQPTNDRQGAISVYFDTDRAKFHRSAFGIETETEVTVSADDDAELRRITATNKSLRTRYIEFTSFAELALAPHNADRTHPAFAKMFVETECVEGRILVARRRPRSPEDPPLWAAHVMVGAQGQIQYETDRRQFLGRGNTAALPDALKGDLSGTTGAVLDPIFSLRCRLTIDPRARHEITFVTVAGTSREAVLALAAKYGRPESVARAFEVAWTRAQLEFRYLGIGLAAAQRFQDLAGYLVYPSPQMRPSGDSLVRNRLGQRGLWAQGISGDLPILTAAISEIRGLPLVRELLLAHTYWRMRGFRADFVILNQESPSYDRPLRLQIDRMIDAHSLFTGRDKPGGVFLRDWYSMPDEDRTLLLAASSAVLYGSRGPLRQQIPQATELPPGPSFQIAGSTVEEPSQPLPFLELPYFNGIGGFTRDGNEYAIYLRPGGKTPAPWVNVIAHPGFGTIVGESGLGCTWSGNSQSNRLTPWHNDPVKDLQSEVIYLRDDESGAVWTPTALPIRENDAHRARHGQGYTVFEHNSHAISQELTVFVPTVADGGDPVKICRLLLRNDSSRPRRLTVTYFAEWVLGNDREEQQLHVQTSWDAKSHALLARNSWNNGSYAGSVAFAASSPAASSYSGDRANFLGRNGSYATPDGLQRSKLDNRTGAGMDPAAALQVTLRLDRGQQAEVIFFLGQAASVDDVRTLLSRYETTAQVMAALDETRRFWHTRLDVLQFRTPVLSVDLLLNRWLLYQSLCCRMWARSAFYQSGGAFGFRDQLQDSMAMFYCAPHLAREHILLSASRQFPEGDVQHWWHVETGSGVRTLCSDDLVWLPFVVARYVEVTGDTGILDEQVPFIDGPLLEPGEHEKLFAASVSNETASLWEHCRRALDHSLGVGGHGLPLMGNGDWNDGMNLVGAGGKGESVWLAWFLCATLKLFAPLSQARDAAIAASWRARIDVLSKAVEESSWDGEWYLRAFFDNGVPLGSKTSPEAKIDSLPQSWAVISEAADPNRARQAMESAERMLVREKDRLVLLFTPPFENSEPNPGYIMGYPPGIRENGGQYTHGSLWMALAWARLQDGNRAVRLLQLMNPIEYSRDPEHSARYQTEPYVVAADVYAAPDKVGRGGWTWYTGSAGWMYRIWVEEVLGFRLRGETLTIDPVLPADWPGFDMTYRYRSSVYEIAVKKSREVQAVTAEEDGRLLPDAVIRLVDDGKTRHISIKLPQVN
jgi:cyclic beta-1,2-glucan synthetase